MSSWEDASSNIASGSTQSAIRGCVAAAVIYENTNTAFAPEPATTDDAAGGRGRSEVNRSCGIMDRNQAVRGFGERQAINAPIQGAAADIMRRAMIRMPGAISEIEGARMLLQVHDELVFEVPENNADALIAVAKTTMENAAMPAVNISVPLVVEAHAAKNWNDAH